MGERDNLHDLEDAAAERSSARRRAAGQVDQQPSRTPASGWRRARKSSGTGARRTTTNGALVRLLRMHRRRSAPALPAGVLLNRDRRRRAPARQQQQKSAACAFQNPGEGRQEENVVFRSRFGQIPTPNAHQKRQMKIAAAYRKCKDGKLQKAPVLQFLNPGHLVLLDVREHDALPGMGHRSAMYRNSWGKRYAI